MHLQPALIKMPTHPPSQTYAGRTGCTGGRRRPAAPAAAWAPQPPACQPPPPGARCARCTAAPRSRAAGGTGRDRGWGWLPPAARRATPLGAPAPQGCPPAGGCCICVRTRVIIKCKSQNAILFVVLPHLRRQSSAGRRPWPLSGSPGTAHLLTACSSCCFISSERAASVAAAPVEPGPAPGAAVHRRRRRRRSSCR